MMLMQWLKDRRDRKAAAGDCIRWPDPVQRACLLCGLRGCGRMDGRFDLLCLHVFLLIERLEQFGQAGHKVGQAVFDRMFSNVALTLREIGIGDLGVPKHMNKMMKAFNGRVHAYHEAIASGETAALQLAVSRNVFRANAARRFRPVLMRSWDILETHALFAHEAFEDFMIARVRFPAVGMKQREARRA